MYLRESRRTNRDGSVVRYLQLASSGVERVLFALVAQRPLAPASKLAGTRWVAERVAIEGLAGFTDDQAYRAMDFLLEALSEIAGAILGSVAHLLNLDLDLVFVDITSTYFERDTEEAPSQEQPSGGLRRYGHSKDYRDDLPQIIIGLAVTREGIPVRCWVWPGNTADTSVLPEVKDGLCGWRLGRVVTVVDRGFSFAANLDYLRRAGGHWIAVERMRDGNPRAHAALSRQGRYRSVRDNLRVKEVRLDDSAAAAAPGEPWVRWIVCHNPDEAKREKTRLDQALARLIAELDRIKTARARDAERRKTATTTKIGKKAVIVDPENAHVKAECALRDHPTLGRWLRQRPFGRLVLDREDHRGDAAGRQVPALDL